MNLVILLIMIPLFQNYKQHQKILLTGMPNVRKMERYFSDIYLTVLAAEDVAIDILIRTHLLGLMTRKN